MWNNSAFKKAINNFGKFYSLKNILHTYKNMLNFMPLVYIDRRRTMCAVELLFYCTDRIAKRAESEKLAKYVRIVFVGCNVTQIYLIYISSYF